MRWVTCVTAPILLADVGDYRVRVLSLDLKRSDERVFGVHGDVVRLPFAGAIKLADEVSACGADGGRRFFLLISIARPA